MLKDCTVEAAVLRMLSWECILRNKTGDFVTASNQCNPVQSCSSLRQLISLGLNWNSCAISFVELFMGEK